MAFATWISPEFQLYIMKDYRRLKQDENSRLSLDWNLNRALSKVNYRIHTDAVKENLIPPELTPEQIAYAWLFTFFKLACLRALLICGSSIRREKIAFASGYLRETSLMRSSIIIKLRTESSVSESSAGSHPQLFASSSLLSSIKDIRKWRLRRTSTNSNQLVDFGV